LDASLLHKQTFEIGLRQETSADPWREALVLEREAALAFLEKVDRSTEMPAASESAALCAQPLYALL
jgi:hypothetical protein